MLFGVQAHAATPTVSLNVQLKQTLTRETSWDQSQAVVSGHSIYLPSISGVKVIAKNLDDQTTKWVFDPSDSDQIYSMDNVNGVIYIRTMHSLYAIKDDQTTATLLWKKDNGYSNLAEDNNTLFAFSGGAVVALDPNTMANRWQYTLPGTVTAESDFTFGDGKVYFVGNDRSSMENEVFALNETTGQVLWTSNMADVQSKLAYANGQLFVSTPSTMVVLNTADGSLKKQWTNDQNFTYALNDQHLVIRSNQGNLKSYNLQTLQQEWQTTFSDRIVGDTYDTTSTGLILLSTQYALIENDGLIKWFDLSSGKQVLVTQNGAIKMTPVELDDNFLVTKDSNYNYYTYQAPTDSTQSGTGTTTLAPAPSYKMYTVAAGDTLWKIASSNGTTVQAIVNLNKLDVNKYLYVGQQLEIPVANAPVQTPTTGTTTPTKTYTVQSGDTLWKIASANGVTTQALITANNLDPSKYLYIGQVLVIPSANATTAQPTQPAQKTYTVQSGDTLWKIASANGTTTQALVDFNNLDPNKYLYVGQKLLLP